MAENRASDKNLSFDYDLIVLGAGAAGIGCAKAASKLGAKVACFECANPAQSDGLKDITFDKARKLMYESALLKESIEDSISFSYPFQEPEIDWKKYVQILKKQIADFEQIMKGELKALKIDYFEALGYFIDRHTIEYITEPDIKKTVTGKYILIAVAADSIIPDVPGAELGITRNDILNLKKPPGDSLIVGSNYHCLETASFLRLLNFDVTIISEYSILPELDQQMIEITLEAMSTRGIIFLNSHYVYGADKSVVGRVSVEYVDSSFNQMKNTIYDTVVWCMESAVDINKFRCESIDIEVKNKLVVVNEYDQTSVPNIYAIGDICASNQFSSIVRFAGHLLAKRLFSDSQRILTFKDFTTTILSMPEYSFIGMTEDEAIEKYGDDNVEVYHGFFRPLEYYIPKKSANHCYAKVITHLEGDEPVLGLHYTGPFAGDVIQGFATAMCCGLTAKILFHTIHIHPTVAAEFPDLTITKRSELDPNPNIPCS